MMSILIHTTHKATKKNNSNNIFHNAGLSLGLPNGDGFTEAGVGVAGVMGFTAFSTAVMSFSSWRRVDATGGQWLNDEDGVVLPPLDI